MFKNSFVPYVAHGGFNKDSVVVVCLGENTTVDDVIWESICNTFRSYPDRITKMAKKRKDIIREDIVKSNNFGTFYHEVDGNVYVEFTKAVG